MEELTENWLRYQGYLTQTHIPIPILGQKGKALGDLDILAVKGNDVVLVECSTFVGIPTVRAHLNKILTTLHQARDYILQHYPVPTTEEYRLLDSCWQRYP